MPEYVDITPTPRVLRVLGEIPFEPWQCIAELVDNSLDGFGGPDEIPANARRIVVSWSGPSVGEAEAVLEIQDTGPGMKLETLKNVVKAGYTTNDPVANLGLFGMGFNIATARLGDRTTIYSATRDSTEWVGIEIDFARLIGGETFLATVVGQSKNHPDEHGTKIVVSNMNPRKVSQLRSQGVNIRRRLERIYTPILQSANTEIMVQGISLAARPPCSWGAERYVSSRSGNVTAAIRTVDESFGEALFDTKLNRYLTPDEEVAARQHASEHGNLDDGVIVREKRVRGWLGIQRYSDPDDYGIDFIRNGRKILTGDKSLFYYENPLSGTREVEYPMELATTVGGRIIGEIYIDHVPPTYQKTDFDRSDPSWFEMVDCLRGSGPILPRKRQLLGFSEPNTSPLAELSNAYRRPDAGTRYLMAPNQQAREWAKRYRNGEAEYQTDDKWWRAAQEADRARADRGAEEAPPVDPGVEITDDVGAYGPGSTEGPEQVPPVADGVGPAEPDETALVDNSPEALKVRSDLLTEYSGEYRYDPSRPPVNVRVWQLREGTMGDGDPGAPCLKFSEGVELDFFFNPRHPFLTTYPVGFHELLLLYLSEHFKVRDATIVTDITNPFIGMMTSRFSDTRIEPALVIEKAQAVFDRLRERTISLLGVREQQVIELIHESSGDVEEIMGSLINNPSLLEKFQRREIGAIAAIAVAPARTLIRLIDRMPEEFFDDKIFSTPYSSIQLPDAMATERLRNEAKDRVLSFLKDALWALTEGQRPSSSQRKKDELARCSHSISFLNQEMAE